MPTIADQIRAVIRKHGCATTDEIVAALPHIERRKIVDAIRLIVDRPMKRHRTTGIKWKHTGWKLTQ